MIRFLLLILIVSSGGSALFYDAYHGVPITVDTVKRHDKSNTTFWCVNEIEPCDPLEGRRVDGSCNNLKYPSRGASHTPFTRVLPPVFDTNFEPKKSTTGNDMPLARYLRTRLISVGKVPSQVFTQLAIHYFVFMSADVVSLHDTVNYIVWRPYCCAAKGKTDPMCVPNKIPEDDPVHRFSGHRCLNMTRPETFQSIGCLPKGTTPERIISSTPLLDLSTIYGNFYKNLHEKGRLYTGGLLKYEIYNGRIWPPSTTSQNNVCFLNQKPYESRCHAMPIWANEFSDGERLLLPMNHCKIRGTIKRMMQLAPQEWHLHLSLYLLCSGLYIYEVAKFVRQHPAFITRAHEAYLRNTRNLDRIVIARVPRTTLYLQNCSVMCGRIYNAMPKNIKELPTYLFLKKLKGWLVNKCFYSIDEFIQCNKENV